MAVATRATAAAKAAKTAPARKRSMLAEDAASYGGDWPKPKRTKLEEPKRERVRITSEPDDSVELGAASSYYTDMGDKGDLTFVSTGATIIDAVLGGGYACGRVVNIVGDKSAGKTLLAIEATANFHIAFPEALKRYGETEHAFDVPYAAALGMPVKAVEFVPDDRPLRTVEDFFADLKAFTKRVRDTGGPGLYVLDTLDALSDEHEQARALKRARLKPGREDSEEDDDDSEKKMKGSYGADKAKMMSEQFRQIVADLEAAQVLLIIVSQLRDKIGAMFGERQTRSGGRALDFYATHIMWLREKSKLVQTINGIKRVIGVEIHARVKKNKVGLPFRECEYPILFGYGIDDLTANVEWLFSVKRHDLLEREFGMSESGYKIRIANLRNKGGDVVRDMRARLRQAVLREWSDIEQGFLPKARKY